jgi:hypothetical protein
MAADEGYVPGELADEVERLDIDMRKQRVEKIKELALLTKYERNET